MFVTTCGWLQLTVCLEFIFLHSNKWFQFMWCLSLSFVCLLGLQVCCSFTCSSDEHLCSHVFLSSVLFLCFFLLVFFFLCFGVRHIPSTIHILCNNGSNFMSRDGLTPNDTPSMINYVFQSFYWRFFLCAAEHPPPVWQAWIHICRTATKVFILFLQSQMNRLVDIWSWKPKTWSVKVT